MYVDLVGSGKFTRVHFKGNKATTAGGAVYIKSSGSSGTFTSCLWSGNNAPSVSTMFQSSKYSQYCLFFIRNNFTMTFEITFEIYTNY